MAINLDDYADYLQDLSPHSQEVLHAAWPDATKVLSPRGLDNYLKGAGALRGLGKGDSLVENWLDNAPLVAKEVGEDVVGELATVALNLASKTSGAVIELLLATAPTAANRLGDAELFSKYLQFINTLIAQAPRGVRPMLGKLEVLSRPSVLTRNNQEATITVGQQVPFVRNSRVTQDGQTINTVEYDDIGIILRVTPYITSDGLVEMYLNPEISTLTGETVPISNTVDAPVFAMRSAETNVVVPNGETVVIGGLMEDNNTETVKKVPVLGDIPLLGMAFRRKTTSKTKTELLIFLTPLVVEGKAKIAKLSADEKNQMELVPEVFSNQQMKKYLDNLSEDKKVEENKPIPEANQPKTAVEKKSAARSSKRIRPFR